MNRRPLAVLALLVLAPTGGGAALLCGPARGARQDIGFLRDDLRGARGGVAATRDNTTAQLALTRSQLDLTGRQLDVTEQGVVVVRDLLRVSKDTRAITARSFEDLERGLDLVNQGVAVARSLLAAVRPLARQGLQGLAFARQALAVAQGTDAALAAALSTLAARAATGSDQAPTGRQQGPPLSARGRARPGATGKQRARGDHPGDLSHRDDELQVADLRDGAGEENRTRVLSLGNRCTRCAGVQGRVFVGRRRVDVRRRPPRGPDVRVLA